MSEIYSFGEWVRRRRKALDLTQQVLAQQVSCTPSMIRKIEADERRPSRQIAALLAEALAVPEHERDQFLRTARAELAPDQLSPSIDAVPLTPPIPSVALTSLPSGTVTFLFTDIEGSTRRWEEQPDAMRIALARHDAILRAVIERHNGYVFKTIGDAFCAAFTSAPNALAAAVVGQRALAQEEWGAVRPIHVRMALHTGTAEPHDGDYLGQPLNRVARLMATGHGGQVLLSVATRELLLDHLPPDAALYDLGVHQLKDLSRPELIFQLVAPDLPTDFPPLRSLDRRRSNLPAQPTTLIGREREIADLAVLLRRTDVRLVTLTGPGGTGKTRLSLQVAAELLDDITDGVFFINFAPISNPALVVNIIAQTLSLHETSEQPLLERLAIYLHDKHLLLLLDNFEHILAASTVIAHLLSAAPAVKVLVTSRAGLHLSGEHEYPVAPLELPDLAQLPTVEILIRYAAVALFVQRAQLTQPAFTLTDVNAAAIAEICRRLDGLPLAIELAAARSKLLSPSAILARLTSRLQLLTRGARDLPERQQTLRSTIAWSYNLLNADEQTLFRRLAVFVDGGTLDAVQAICNSDGDESAHSDAAGFRASFTILDGLAVLVDQSLLRQEEQFDHEPRFMLLQTIREYALEQLEASGEAAAIREKHAHFYMGLAEQAEPQLTLGEQHAWLKRLEREHDNLRTALAWSQVMPEGAHVGLRLASALWLFWWIRGYVSEGRSWLEHALAQMRFVQLDANEVARSHSMSRTERSAPRTSEHYRATALYRAAFLAVTQGDYPHATALSIESLVLARKLNDTERVAWALFTLGMRALYQGDHVRAVVDYDEALTLFRNQGDLRGVGWTLNDLAVITVAQGDYDRAAAGLEEALALFRSMVDIQDIGGCLNNLGEIAAVKNDYPKAIAYYTEALALARSVNNTYRISAPLHGMGRVLQAQGDSARARVLLEESVHFCQKTGYRFGAAQALCELGIIALTMGQLVHAALLFGSAEAQHTNIGAFVLLPTEQAAYTHSLATVCAELGDAAFTAAWTEGFALTPSQAIAASQPQPDVD